MTGHNLTTPGCPDCGAAPCDARKVHDDPFDPDSPAYRCSACGSTYTHRDAELAAR